MANGAHVAGESFVVMSRVIRLAVLLLVAIVATQWWSGREHGVPVGAEVAADARIESPRAETESQRVLPREATATLLAIERGGPFPYERDGVVFENRERVLPQRPRGYYREYTVTMPGASRRGARRIVTGGTPPEAYYYTDDHYRTFHRVEPPR
jgi:guanyl-specific ribonuclease Sa